MPSATAHGYRVVRSENVHWYLDQTVRKPWTATYEFEPCGDIPDESCAFILGGAASMCECAATRCKSHARNHTALSLI